MAKSRTTTICAKCGAVHLDQFQACRRCGEPLPDQPANVTGESAITLSRRLIKSLRMVLRLALNITRRSAGPTVQLRAGPGGLRIRCRGQQAAVEWCRPGELPNWAVTLPFELLPDCEGNNEEPVTIECSNDDRVLTRWHDNGIPRVRQYDVPEMDEQDFPSRPDLMSSNSPQFLLALRDAMGSVNTKSLRNAINCVQADGA